VPALNKLPMKYRHEPWKMADEEAKKYGFQLGKDYPSPLVDHQFARQRTLDAYKTARGE
jgi:deoxyribodipyrimidine photo-lyase